MAEETMDEYERGSSVKSESAASEYSVQEVTHRALVNRGYVIGKMIGQGMYGSILVARSKQHHRQMAIKVAEVFTNGEIDEEKRWAIENEKTFADLFDHPHLNVCHEIILTPRR